MQRATPGAHTIAFPTPFPTGPKDRRPFKFWKLMLLPRPSSPGATHSRSTESSSLPAPLLSARPRGQWGVACPRGPPYPRARLRQRPKAGVWDVGPANPSRRPPVRPFPGHQEVEALQGQRPRGHRERVSGLWSCNREGRRLKAEWRAGLGSG